MGGEERMAGMRHARIKNEAMECGYYHAICRTVGQSFYFDDNEEKDRLLLWLDKAEDFCGVEVRAWCVMSNHVHLLVKVPPHTDCAKVSDEELHRRMQRLYLPKRYQAILQQWEDWRRIDGNDRRVEAAKARLRERMNDISCFMSTFKQAVAQDYNARHHHSGSIWGGSRFKSVYLQGSLAVQLSVAAYIHLNPVRAGIVGSPEQYRWSSWGDACSRNNRSRSALARLLNELLPSTAQLPWTKVKSHLSAVHALARAHDGDLCENEVAKLFASAELIPSTAPQQKPPAAPPRLATMLAAKSPAFTSAPILGSSDFIRRFFETSTGRFASARRHCRFIPVAECARVPLCALRDSRLGRGGK